MQSVLASTYYGKTPPSWVATVAKIDRASESKMHRYWHRFARQIVTRRDLKADENRFMAATSPAIFAIDTGQTGLGAYQDDPAGAMGRWKRLAWVSTDSNATVSNDVAEFALGSRSQ